MRSASRSRSAGSRSPPVRAWSQTRTASSSCLPEPVRRFLRIPRRFAAQIAGHNLDKTRSGGHIERSHTSPVARRPRGPGLPAGRDPGLHPGHHDALQRPGLCRARLEREAARHLPDERAAQHRPHRIRRRHPDGQDARGRAHLPDRRRRRVPRRLADRRHRRPRLAARERGRQLAAHRAGRRHDRARLRHRSLGPAHRSAAV